MRYKKKSKAEVEAEAKEKAEAEKARMADNIVAHLVDVIEMHTLAKTPITSTALRNAVLGGMAAPPPTKPDLEADRIVEIEAGKMADAEAVEKSRKKYDKEFSYRTPPPASFDDDDDDYILDLSDLDEDEEDDEYEDDEDDEDDVLMHMVMKCEGWSSADHRLYLFVPFDKRAEAKRYGALWHRASNRWYVSESALKLRTDRFAKLKKWTTRTAEYGVAGFGSKIPSHVIEKIGINPKGQIIRASAPYEYLLGHLTRTDEDGEIHADLV